MINQVAYDKLAEMIEFVDGKPYKDDSLTGKLKEGYRILKVYTSSKATEIRAHRLNFYKYHGWVPDMIDHWDLDKDNNDISNLRPATAFQNNANKAPLIGRASIYKGVSRSGRRWRAELSRCRLGCYDNEVDAAMAYDDAARWIYGGFAWLNSDHFEECTG